VYVIVRTLPSLDTNELMSPMVLPPRITTRTTRAGVTNGAADAFDVRLRQLAQRYVSTTAFEMLSLVTEDR
jgi:hypothetical protein